jgi:2',3'-cyclic-nucleotide 2'-phosphodiesterase/3'-nucleotidase
VDITVCIYHGGFENDLETGELLSATGENQAYRICKELDFDVLLTGHQHQPKAGLQLFGTHACQAPDRAKQYVRMDVTVSEQGDVTAHSQLVNPSVPKESMASFLAPLDAQNAIFLDQPLGELDIPLTPGEHMEMAVNGSMIANFFNQVQLDASGADLSVTSLGNLVKGFDRQVTIRDVVATYVFPNTLKTILVDRQVLKAALERSAEYFERNEAGQLQIGRSFLMPIVQHYNYDYLTGLEVTIDVGRPVGDRVVSMLYQGKELSPDQKLTLCLNNYRATGTGGYPLYPQCQLVKDQPTEISEMIIEYIDRHKQVTVDKHQWLHVIY